MSSGLFDIMEKGENGAMYTHPEKKTTRKQLMAGYVGDRSINISKTHGNNIRKEMRKEIQ